MSRKSISSTPITPEVLMRNAQYLKHLREEKGLSQRELAKLMDISNAEISRIESNIRQKVTARQLDKYATALNVNLLTLYEMYGYIDSTDLAAWKFSLSEVSDQALLDELGRRLILRHLK